ncbi:MAG: flagellar biosynthesis protein FlhF [Spirochaetia bacterium]|nr:flagellar biosynthesis protein FlhF [Spirochaetia bacterium]
MQYVKVIGDSHSEALKKLRDTYGSEAFIYHEKEIPAKTALSRLIGKKQFLIEAALHEKKDSPSTLEKISRLSNSGNNNGSKNANNNEFLRKTEKTVQAIPVRLNESDTVVSAPAKKKHAGEEFLALLDQEGATDSRTKFNLEDISIEKKFPITRPREREREKPDAGKSPVLNMHSLQNDLNDIKEKISILIKSPVYTENRNEIDRLKENLFEQEFSPRWITEFIQDIKQSVPESDWSIPTKIYLKAREIIGAKIKVNSSMNLRRVSVLLGPTGVGKTTSIAKLAARLKLQDNRRVTLITLDNYRIAATEQLKVYGDIMDIPVFVIKEPEKFKQKITGDSADHILVDTTGFSHNNKDFLIKQKAYFEGIDQDIEKHLVIAGTSKIFDATSVLEKFSEYGLNKIILSKLDETTQIGGFIELAERWNLPFSFFTNGQRVPDDYLPADKNYLAEKVLFRLKEKCLFTP